MAENKEYTRKQRRKMREKEAKRLLKEEKRRKKRGYGRISEDDELSGGAAERDADRSDSSEEASNRRSRPRRKGFDADEARRAARINKEKKSVRKKHKIKKRFYVYVVLMAIILAAIIFFSVKMLMNIMGPDNGARDENLDPNSVEAVVNVNEIYDKADPSLMYSPVSTDPEYDEYEKEAEEVDDISSYSLEYRICSAVLSDWHISPLKQTEEVVESTFGKLSRYEDWAGGIYYHKEFPETMYVTYGGNVVDNQPQKDAICDSVSVCLGVVMEFETFTPDESIWGRIYKDDSGEGWTECFYSLLIDSGVNLIVYCNEDGSVSMDTHIVVRKI